jgi:hypothetical protein
MDNKNKHNDELLARGHLNLHANQQGQMTAQQKDWLNRDIKEERQRQLQMVYISCGVLLVVAVVLALMPLLPIPLLAVPLIWGSGVAVWYGVVWKQQKPIRDDLDAGTVNAVTGYIDKNKEHGYHVILNGVNYATPPDLYPIFDETQHYTIYVTPKSKIVLSAEIITEPED